MWTFVVGVARTVVGGWVRGFVWSGFVVLGGFGCGIRWRCCLFRSAGLGAGGRGGAVLGCSVVGVVEAFVFCFFVVWV